METVCCICSRIKEGGRWVRGAPRPGFAVSHGFCPECYRMTIRRIENAGRGRNLRPAA